MRNFKIVVLLMSFLIIIVSCKSQQTEKTIVKGTGTITYLDFEGGFYGIIADDGKRYDPVNLASTFEKNGLRVQFKARIKSNLVRHNMWGSIIELVYIDTL